MCIVSMHDHKFMQVQAYIRDPHNYCLLVFWDKREWGWGCLISDGADGLRGDCCVYDCGTLCGHKQVVADAIL